MSGTTNLGITYIQASQNQKEVTANAAFDALDKALTETFDANLASASVTLTDAQYRQALAVRAQNATVAGRTVTLPARERLTVLVMDSSCTQEVGFVRGSTTLTLAPGQAVLARTDGSTNGLTALIRGTAATPVTTFLALADTPASYAGQGGRILRVNAGATAVEFGPRHNLAATAAPTATDDSAAGYSVGSQWLDTVGGTFWCCVDASTGAAVWKGVALT